MRIQMRLQQDALWMHMRFYSRDGGLAFYSRGGGWWDRCSGQCVYCYMLFWLLLLLLLLLPLLPLPLRCRCFCCCRRCCCCCCCAAAAAVAVVAVAISCLCYAACHAACHAVFQGAWRTRFVWFMRRMHVSTRAREGQSIVGGFIGSDGTRTHMYSRIHDGNSDA